MGICSAVIIRFCEPEITILDSPKVFSNLKDVDDVHRVRYAIGAILATEDAFSGLLLAILIMHVFALLCGSARQ